jgi:hypothetical protein
MKRILKMTALAFVILLGSSLRNNVSAQSDYHDDSPDYSDSRDVSYQTFYDELSPHGNWIEYPGHGYVWQPGMGNDFRPYSTGGHWVWSDQYEWMWVSDYDWGWAPFHYGRWFSDPSYGWLWVPGYEWSGAWVTWRDGGDYYGWAPIRPGISININFNIGSYSPPIDYWSFAPRRNILSLNIFNHCVDYRTNVTIINQTAIINNYHYGDRYGWRSGPRRFEAERYTGRINPVRFRASSRPGRSEFRNNEVSIYRPNIRSTNNDRIAPKKFDRYDRNGSSDNRTVRTNDTRNGNTGNNDFRNRDRSNDNPRVNTTPREQTNDRRFERKDNNVRTPQTNAGNEANPIERRKLDRTDNTGSNPVREPRVRPTRTEPVTNPGTNNGVIQPRKFERRNDNPARTREAVPQDNNVRMQRPARQADPVREAPRQVEQRRQEQPRQVDRPARGNSENNQQGNSGNNDKGNKKRRF